MARCQTAPMTKPLRDMTVSELKDHLASIREMNPHTYEHLQSYRIALSQLVRLSQGVSA